MTIKDFIECAAPNTGVVLWNAFENLGVYETVHDIPAKYHGCELYRIEIGNKARFDLTIYL